MYRGRHPRQLEPEITIRYQLGKPPAGLGVHVLQDEPGWQASVLRLLDVSSTVFADHPIPITAKVQVDPMPARASCLKTKRATQIW